MGDGKFKSIFTVTTLKEIRETPNRIRTVAWFTTLEDAIKCIKENWGDIYESGHYPYALVEEVPEGLYQYSPVVQNHKW
jgi:hypothetical protein